MSCEAISSHVCIQWRRGSEAIQHILFVHEILERRRKHRQSEFKNGVENADSLNSGSFDCHYSENSSFDLTDPSGGGAQPVGSRLILNFVDPADFRHV
jgi:hypothetical protein